MIIKATCLPSDAVTLVGRIQRISGEDWAVSCNMVNGVVYGYWWDEGVSIDDLETRVKRVRGDNRGAEGPLRDRGLPGTIEGTYRRVGAGRSRGWPDEADQRAVRPERDPESWQVREGNIELW